MAHINIGDVFEISTPKGKAYLHYVYKDASLGELVRVLPGLYPVRPENIDDLASKDEMFLVFFPLAAAQRRKIVEKTGNYQMNIQKPKYMRSKHVVRGEFLGWHIVNTETWKRELVKTLTKEQKHLSSWGIWNDTLLIKRLVEGWSPETWT